jgi:hypothetical protein
VDSHVTRELNERKLHYLGLGKVRADVVDIHLMGELNKRKLQCTWGYRLGWSRRCG